MATLQLPPLCPGPGLSQKELSVLLQHSRSREGDLWTCGWGREKEGVVLASSLSFLPEQPAGPRSLQAPGCRARDLCQDGRGEGRCVPSSATGDRDGSKEGTVGA